MLIIFLQVLSGLDVDCCCSSTLSSCRLGVNIASVKNVIIWGNHSSTQFPDARHATVDISGTATPVYTAVNDDKWLQDAFLTVSSIKFLTNHKKFNSFIPVADYSKERCRSYRRSQDVFGNVSSQSRR